MAIVKVTHNDPYFQTTWPDGELHKPALVAGYNDGHAAEMASPRLAGRTSILPTNIGPLEEITVDLPLHLENEHLWIDLTALQNELNNHEARITALENRATAVETNYATNAALTTETNARVASFTSVANTAVAQGDRITAIETRVPTPLANFINDAAAASGGIAVGRMYRNGSVVMIRVT